MLEKLDRESMIVVATDMFSYTMVSGSSKVRPLSALFDFLLFVCDLLDDTLLLDSSAAVLLLCWL